MDTGAKTSSLDARHIQRFSRNGKRWLRFSFTDGAGRTTTLERPLLGTARIKRRHGGVQVRPVVRLKLCVGSIFKYTSVNLTNRRGFDYPLLVGRRFLAGAFIVDPGSIRGKSFYNRHTVIATDEPSRGRIEAGHSTALFIFPSPQYGVVARGA